MTTNVFRDNKDLGRFELEVAGHTAFADYRRAEGKLVIDHVEAPIPLRGAGAAGELMGRLAAEARREGLKIVPVCGYAATWLRRHPEFSDLVA